MSSVLTVRPHDSGSWEITRLGLILRTTGSEHQAVATATELLRGDGGTLNVTDAYGRVRRTMEILPAAASPARPPIADKFEDAAKLLDKATGRSEIFDVPSMEGRLRDLDANVLVPTVIRDSPVVRTSHAHVSAGAAWIGLVAAIGGGGTFAGVVGPAMAASAGKASIGAYLDFGTAFFATFAMCAALGVVVFAFRSGARGLPLVTGFVVSSIVACAVSLKLGLHDPDPATLLGIHPGNPLTTAFGYLRVYFEFYGPIPFLTGLGIGAISGSLAYRISKA
jgi:hypothetical protein